MKMFSLVIFNMTNDNDQRHNFIADCEAHARFSYSDAINNGDRRLFI
jgi:hypothetical protein